MLEGGDISPLFCFLARKYHESEKYIGGNCRQTLAGR